MTTFWSTWICVLTIGSLIGLTWLLVGTRKGETKGSVDQTMGHAFDGIEEYDCLLYTSPSPRDQRGSRMPSSA